MAKGKKRDYSLPKGVTSRQEQSKLAKLWKKGKNERVEVFKFDKGFGFGKPGGYIEVPSPKFFYDEYSGEWSKEALRQLLETMPKPDYKPEVKKPPAEEFADEWYEKNKDSV